MSEQESVNDLQPWKLLDAHLLLAALPWVRVYRERVELPSGRVIDDFHRVVLPDFAVVVAVTPDGELVMVRGYRHGPRRVCLSAPAGLVEPGELPLATAQRELREETGYTAARWEPLGSFTVDGNRQCGTAHLFLARDARREGPGNQGDEMEQVQVELMKPEGFLGAIRQGDIVLLGTVSAVALALAACTAGEIRRC